ncbi:hypothetical protein, partial [Ruminococcus sp.]|uniref:hypothetical protein n=1 Tax=Ruminococcus sp. TaxID=41978 RepID=UPI002E80F33D
MRDMSKFSRTAAGISKKAVAIAIAFAMSLPNAAYANNVTANYQTAQYEEEFEDENGNLVNRTMLLKRQREEN